MAKSLFKNNAAFGEALVAGTRANLTKKKVEVKINEKFELEQQRQRDADMMEDMGAKGSQNLIDPEYAYDERLKIHREINPPPESLYIAIGFN